MPPSFLLPRALFGSLLFSSSIALAVPPSLAAPTSQIASDRIAPDVSPGTAVRFSPGQPDDLPRRSAPHAARRSPTSTPERQVGAANDAARIEPGDAGFDNAIQRYVFTEGALFQVYAMPGQVTDIALQEGESLVGPGPVAAGDTARWMIGDTLSGSGAGSRVHILVKPTRSDISTNLVINTDRRTYHLELRANPRVYMASVSWTYPEDELIALRLAEQEAKRTAPIADGLMLESLNFDYRITGDKPAWRPLRVFDDGRRTLVEFTPEIARHEMPPIFVIGKGGDAELVNYRVSGRHLILDRLIDKAELRLGQGRKQLRVTITNLARSRS